MFYYFKTECNDQSLHFKNGSNMFHDNFVVYCCSIYYERLLKKINLSDFREVLNVLKYKEYYFMSLKTQL